MKKVGAPNHPRKAVQPYSWSEIQTQLFTFSTLPTFLLSICPVWPPGGHLYSIPYHKYLSSSRPFWFWLALGALSAFYFGNLHPPWQPLVPLYPPFTLQPWVLLQPDRRKSSCSLEGVSDGDGEEDVWAAVHRELIVKTSHRNSRTLSCLALAVHEPGYAHHHLHLWVSSYEWDNSSTALVTKRAWEQPGIEQWSICHNALALYLATSRWGVKGQMTAIIRGGAVCPLTWKG